METHAGRFACRAAGGRESPVGWFEGIEVCVKSRPHYKNLASRQIHQRNKRRVTDSPCTYLSLQLQNSSYKSVGFWQRSDKSEKGNLFVGQGAYC
jgi:hypothetical protein